MSRRWMRHGVAFLTVSEWRAVEGLCGGMPTGDPRTSEIHRASGRRLTSRSRPQFARADRARSARPRTHGHLPAPAAKPPFPSSSKASRTSEKWTRATGFVLPLGYSFNVGGSMPYMTFASVFLLNIGPKCRQIHRRPHTNAQLLPKTPYYRTPRKTDDG